MKFGGATEVWEEATASTATAVVKHCRLKKVAILRALCLAEVGLSAKPVIKPVGLIPFQNLNSFIGYLLQYFGNFYRELSSSHQSVSQPGKGFSQVRGSRWVIPARGLLKCF